MRKIACIAFVALSVFLPFIAHAMPVYFVVSELNPEAGHGDSYVLPLEDVNAINHARNLIENGPSIGGTIVVASIAAGADGINRDVLASGQPLWSWHITKFLGFADITAEILDGWPGFVEQDVEGWIANTGGKIGFWSYTVTQELAVPEPGTLFLMFSGLFGLVLCKRWEKGSENIKGKMMLPFEKGKRGQTPFLRHLFCNRSALTVVN